jgi:hypothetical protein
MALAENGQDGVVDDVMLSDDDFSDFLAEGLIFFDQCLGTVDV